MALVAAFSLAGHANALSVAPKAAKPGPVGRPITLGKHIQLAPAGVDVATSKSGTAYVGWIADHSTSRSVYLCVLPLHATACKGGIQSTPSLDNPGARDLKVLATQNGTITFLWFDDKITTKTGPRNGEILESTVGANGSLSGSGIVATAPTNGDLVDADVAPNGDIWTVTKTDLGNNTIEVGPLRSNPKTTLRAPFGVGYCLIAFSGTSAVIVVQKAGAVTVPDSYTYSTGRSWAKFHSIARTWAGANPGLVSTTSGVRYIGTINNADYNPVVSRWTGHSFTLRQPTGDTSNCSPSTHDAVTDASGRVADVSAECDTYLSVSNLADTYHAGIVRFRPAGDFAGSTPQIATTPRGDAWVTWSIESGGSALGMTLKVQALLLPGLQQQASKQGRHGRVTLTGPASCLPDDTISIGVAGYGDTHWSVTSRRITLGSRTLSSTLDGASLRAGQLYTLKGSVTFSNGGSHSTTNVELRFRACASP